MKTAPIPTGSIVEYITPVGLNIAGPAANPWLHIARSVRYG